ncbi:MAG: hypothetical protein V2A75_01380 [Pseudomonadota bacterium]
MRNLFIGITLIVLVHYFFFLFGFSISEYPNANFYMDGNITLEEKGVLGDYTSGHFSILAFLWLAYGIFIQSKEFGLQRKEFENQTEQFKEQNILYSNQLKELEIQSTKNDFDRYIMILTEMEKSIAEVLDCKNDIYIFNSKCEKSDSLAHFISKIPLIEKYILLYDNLRDIVISNINVVNLENDLYLLKKDIYFGLKMSYLILLHYLIIANQANRLYSTALSPKKIYELSQLNIYKKLSDNYDDDTIAFNAVSRITNKFNDLYELNIFKKD